MALQSAAVFMVGPTYLWLVFQDDHFPIIRALSTLLRMHGTYTDKHSYMHVRQYEVFCPPPYKGLASLAMMFKHRRRANIAMPANTATPANNAMPNVPDQLCDRNTHENMAESELLCVNVATMFFSRAVV